MLYNFLSIMQQDKNITQWFGVNLAQLLGEKIKLVYTDFNSHTYIDIIQKNCMNMSYSKRVELHADALKICLPQDYSTAINILMAILGEENPHETGMFTHFYWIMPIGKFVEKYGREYFDISIQAIEEITKRNTGEYAIRPYIRIYPEKTIHIMQWWSKSKNFHLRRLSSEGSRPKLPWATKLEVFITDPQPVFTILENLMQDDIRFVQKSVANNIADYLKVHTSFAVEYIKKYQNSDNKNTQWIIRYATRKTQV